MMMTWVIETCVERFGVWALNYFSVLIQLLDLEITSLIMQLFIFPGTEFLKPVILNIPHYANTLPSLGISLKATDSEQDMCTDWDNILLPSNHAADRVSVKVDHF